MPRKSEHLYSNYEKMKFLNPKKELGILQKLTKKTVSTQTIDFTKVPILAQLQRILIKNFNSNLTKYKKKQASLFGVDSEDQVHPIYENRDRHGPSKTHILMPINGQQRVTDKVF